MSSAALRTRVTPDQYLAAERKAAFKSEYLDGYITAKPGASLHHNRITGASVSNIPKRTTFEWHF
jgi:Uma2 family endonuclease